MSRCGLLDRVGENVSILQGAVPTTAKVLTAARSAGIRIVYLKMGFRPDLSDICIGSQRTEALLDQRGNAETGDDLPSLLNITTAVAGVAHTQVGVRPLPIEATQRCHSKSAQAR